MMRVTLDGVPLETAQYAENGDIHFTCFTDGVAYFAALSRLLEAPGRVLALRRGDEQIPVRVLEHAIWPPFAHGSEDIVHRHEVRLAPARAPA
ncbi:MAG TPA: hypothetical protein VHB98_02025 [Chloroflexota bacterium]|nr:hypothetical protein [Chloroflexota bacterium]